MLEFDFCAEWSNCLLKGLETETAQDRTFEHCANFHYQLNQMDRTLEPFIGDLEGFLLFLTQSYGWKITRSEDGKAIYADENKDFCVCPVADKLKGRVSPLLCNCSALYAQKMFSKVCQKQVQAQVKRSFIRDGKSCVYEIRI